MTGLAQTISAGTVPKVALVGLQIYGAEALLRSLVIDATIRSMKRLHVHVSVKDIGESSVPIEKSTAQCCVPAQRTAPPAASCCAK
jgi:hypothetical protein